MRLNPFVCQVNFRPVLKTSVQMYVNKVGLNPFVCQVNFRRIFGLWVMKLWWLSQSLRMPGQFPSEAQVECFI